MYITSKVSIECILQTVDLFKMKTRYKIPSSFLFVHVGEYITLDFKKSRLSSMELKTGCLMNWKWSIIRANKLSSCLELVPVEGIV